MKYCVRCAKLIYESADFCSFCGAKQILDMLIELEMLFLRRQ